MTLEEYIPLAQRTSAPKSRELMLCHAAIGFATECLELLAALHDPAQSEGTVMEEYDDTLWYVAEYMAACKITTLPAVHSAALPSDALASLLDEIKRHVFYGAPLDHRYLTLYLDSLAHKCGFAGELPAQAMERNIAKLRVRYPEKFTQANAVQRDLFAERKALDGQSDTL